LGLHVTTPGWLPVSDQYVDVRSIYHVHRHALFFLLLLDSYCWNNGVLAL
jgi:hypothetical protein